MAGADYVRAPRRPIPTALGASCCAKAATARPDLDAGVDTMSSTAHSAAHAGGGSSTDGRLPVRQQEALADAVAASARAPARPGEVTWARRRGSSTAGC